MATIAERIALLKLNQPGQGPPSPPAPSNVGALNSARPRPPPPPLPNRRPGLQQAQSDYRVETIGLAASHAHANLPNGALPSKSQNLPALPVRRPTGDSANVTDSRRSSEVPALPGRRTGTTLTRQDSRESISSMASGKSGYSLASTRTASSVQTPSPGPLFAIRAPAFDATKLPPLPPKREKEEAPKPPERPQPVPAGRAAPGLPARSQTSVPNIGKTVDGTRRTEPPPARKSALTQGFGNSTARASPQPPSVPTRPNSQPPANGTPPPIPTNSRPDLGQLKLSKPKPASTSATPTAVAPAAISAPVPASDGPGCLLCRDFSAPDAHAARFPRQSLPTQDLGWLAQSLTQPFSSATDKARAIFTWLHHNIAYDTVSFFANTVRPATPADTFSSGLAVCAGYAGLFATLCVKAGLQSHVINGHGKGYGHSPLGPGSPCPPPSMNHAWNAVLLESGWKLVDSCWGSGHLGEAQSYNQKLDPAHFTMSNEKFGLRHFPEDRRSFYRSDGACPSWETYMLGEAGAGEGPKLCGGVCEEEGLDSATLQPGTMAISLGALRARAQPSLRFSLNKLCPHWDPERNGPGRNYCYWVMVDYPGGENDKWHPVDTNGWTWWVDIPVSKLGTVGGQVKMAAVTDVGGRSGRGMTPAEMREKLATRTLGCWSSRFVATWNLVA